MAVGIQDNTKTGDPYIDPLLSGWRWDGGPVSYGFPQTASVYGDANSYYYQYPNAHFQPVSQMTMEAVRALLDSDTPQTGASMTLTPVSGFTNLTFTETDPATMAADMRFGEASTVPNSFGFNPGEHSADGGADGDVWLADAGAYGTAFQLQTPVNGTWAYYATLWAIGKALGLNSGYMDIPADKQFKEYTAMTYQSAPSVDLSNAASGPDALEGGRPEIQNMQYYTSQTYMMLDIAALQQMYGANYGFRSDDTVYTWSPTTGAVSVNGSLKGVAGDGLASAAHMNMIFQTIWDGGGNDTYDLSNYATDLKLDLRPGEYSAFSDAQRPYIGRDIHGNNWYARGNVYNALLHDGDPRSLIENAKGGSGTDTITGNQADNHLWGNGGNDTLQGGAGNDTLDGGDGIDTASFSGARSDYTVTQNTDGSFTISDTATSRDGTDTLTSIDFATFSDQTLTLLAAATTAPSIRTEGSKDASAANHLSGGSGSDRLYGSEGNDTLNGGFGDDRLVGGHGRDSFVFDSRLGTSSTDRRVNFDTIVDYSVHDDRIMLDHGIFKKLGHPGRLKSDVFVVGEKARDKNDHVIYDQKTGILSYDDDGSGPHKAVEFARLKSSPALKYFDLYVI